MTTRRYDLESLGWDRSWREAAAAYPCARPGRIARVDRGLCTVLTADGTQRASVGSTVLEATARDATTAPTTGDWCVVREWPDGPLTVEAVLPRRTTIIRAEVSGTSRGQVLAANVDVVAVVAALHPDPKPSRLERLLTLAWESGARPVVVLTKADLVPDAELVAEDVAGIAPDVDVLWCSTATGEGVDRVRALAGQGRTLGLVGVSGHGKSSLTNALVGADVLATRALRDDGKGRHTTVRRELVLLPGGGAVIDTPGLRGVGLQASADGVERVYAEIVALAEHCAFPDCSHESEPACAVQAAVESGALRLRRLESWRRLRKEAADTKARAERRAARHRHRRR